MGFGFGGIEALAASGMKDPRATGSTTSSAWGELARSLVTAAGAVGVAALDRAAKTPGVGTASLVANNKLLVPGQPTQKTPIGVSMNKSTLIVAGFVVLLGSGLVYFAFKR